MLRLKWMSPHKPQSDLQKVDVDFVEILAGVENSYPQPHSGNAHELELLGSAAREPRRARPRIGESTAVNMTFAAIAFSGALICAFYFLKSPEISRRLHTGWPGEFLYPRPGLESESGRMMDRASAVESNASRQARRNSETTGIFRNLANGSPISGISSGSFVNPGFSSPQLANQTALNFADAGQTNAAQSKNVGQSAMSQMHSAMGEQAPSKKNGESSSMDGARRGHGGMLTSTRTNVSAMQAHSGLSANHIQNRLMTGGLISHALHTGDLGGNVQVRHHGARR